MTRTNKHVIQVKRNYMFETGVTEFWDITKDRHNSVLLCLKTGITKQFVQVQWQLCNGQRHWH